MSKSKKNFFRKFGYQRIVDEYNQSDVKKDSWQIKLLIIILTVGLTTFFFTFHFIPQDNSPLEFSNIPGYVWPGNNIKAEYSFPVFKTLEEYNKDLSETESSALSVFRYDNSSITKAQNFLENRLNQLKALNWGTENLEEFEYKGFDKASIDRLRTLDATNRKRSISRIERFLKDLVRSVYVSGYIDIASENIKNDAIIARFPPEKEKIYKKSNLIDAGNFREILRDKANSQLLDFAATLAIQIANNLNFPNLISSPELTENLVQTLLKNVPKTKGIVREGETIIKKGQRVSSEILDKLKSYERSKLLRTDEYYSIWIVLGSLGHALLLYSILLLYLFFIRKRIFHDNLQFGLLSFVLVFLSLMGWLSVVVPASLPLEYFVMLPALSMLVAIVYDSRTAFYTTVIMSLMLAGIRGNDYDAGTSMLFAGTLAAYSVRDIQSRTQIYKSIFFIFIGFVISIFAIGLERSTEINNMLNKFFVAGMNSAISPLLTFGLLFILERGTKITTDLKLEEYNNLSNPLLTKLNDIAPGTYQHTITLSMLAEKCAKAIGANPLLARVGAYFHDIGKMAKPEYFGENQMDIQNKHDLISPKKSAEAIKYHVLEGIKLAKDAKLPQRLIDFIPMHHGTTLIQHFYAKACELEGQENVNEADYRYPGPKPQSKETAIVMICDSSEALSRLPSKDKSELEKYIEKNIRTKLLDGQFDECNITLNDLNIIKDTCVQNLLGISHPRVAYKEVPKKKSDSED